MRHRDHRRHAAFTRPGRLRRARRRRLARRGALLLLGAGLGLLASVAFDLWGTGVVVTARAQSALRFELATQGFPVRPIPRHAVGIIRIPKVAVDMAFVQGVDLKALAEGPGHYPNTPEPGLGGNVAIAGHRTTHLAPFWSLDTLLRGDEITLQTRAGFFEYRVVWVRVFPSEAWWLTGQTTRPMLTLTTCYPRFSSTQRLVVRAVQVSGRVPGGFLQDGRFTPNRVEVENLH
jgi:sortase A